MASEFENLNFNQRKAKLFSFDSSKLNTKEKGYYYYLFGRTYYLNNNSSEALNYYLKSKDEYKKTEDFDKLASINLDIAELKRVSGYPYDTYKYLLEEAVAYSRKKADSNILCDTYMEIGSSLITQEPTKAIEYYKQCVAENKKVKDTLFEAKVFQNIANAYGEHLHDLEKANFYYDKALKVFEAKKEHDLVSYVYIGKASLLRQQKKYDEAIQFYKKADAIQLKNYSTNLKSLLYGFISDSYKEKGDFKKAFEYLEKKKVYEELLDANKQQIAIQEIDTKYNTKETLKENISLKSAIKHNRTIIVSLVILVIIIFLGYQNLFKKKKLIEQEKQLQTQKLETTLKEQELHEIDVMLESQEKERQRIANELHDNLGSILATLKLNFENLKRHGSDSNAKEIQLFEKTDALIEEAYQKVRNIAHLKNLGVIGSEGLVVAVKKMAEKMSVLEKLQINVIPHGLNERLENTIEVMLFRMIQELCTNIIKHAQASEVNIYLTQLNSNELNIIIEDNGIGFNPKNSSSNSGIGLKSIEKKVEQMHGTFTIDSIQSKGTNIIIDLPV